MVPLLLLLLLGVCFSQKNEINFDPERSLQTAPFNLTLKLPKALRDESLGYQIRYVIHTSNTQYRTVVTRTTGTVYSVPLLISRTSAVHAIAVNATDSWKITTSSYIFVADVVNQPTMYQPNIDNDGRQNVIAGLNAVPSVHLTAAVVYPTNCNECGGNGCNVNPCWPACRADERRLGRAEYIDQENDKNWFEQMSWDIYGGASRMYQKKNIRIYFDGDLDFKQFKGFDWGVGSARRFKHLDLRGHSQDGAFGQNWGGKMMWARNIFQDWTLQDIGRVVPHSRYVHLYFNTNYEGFYHLRERLSGHFFQDYLGMDKDDYEAVNSGRLTDGDAGYANSTYKKIVDIQTFANINKYYDWNNFLTYAMIQHYAGNADLGTHNWQLGGPSATVPFQGKNAGWKFFPSDGDLTFYVLAGVNFDSTYIQFQGDTFLNLLREAHPDFYMLFHDYQWQNFQKIGMVDSFRRFINLLGGLLTPSAVTERFQRIRDLFKMNITMRSELARWGYIGEDYWCKHSSFWTYGQWLSGINSIRDEWFPVRTDIVLSQYAAKGWTNAVGGFDFSLTDRVAYAKGTDLVITSRQTLAGAHFYYTLDGSDPRSPGGSISSKALHGPFSGNKFTLSSLQKPTVISGRVRTAGGSWGPIDTITAVVGDKKACELCGNVIITEVHYAPEEKIRHKSHFIEIKNIGNTDMDLTGAKITGINTYYFPSVILAPGKFFVISLFWEDFNLAFGRYADDVHLVQISQDANGDHIKFKDGFDNMVHDLDFGTKKPWSEFALLIGYSLVAEPSFYKDIAKRSDDAKEKHARYWRHSTDIDGSPYKDDPPVPDYRKVKIDFSFVSFEDDWVELFNPTDKDVDISGWCLQDKYTFKSDNHEYFVPAGSVVRAKSYFKIKKNGLGIGRGNNPVIFQYNSTLDRFTGAFAEFEIEETELAF